MNLSRDLGHYRKWREPSKDLPNRSDGENRQRKEFVETALEPVSGFRGCAPNQAKKKTN
jgi:hypothetical protein